MRLLKQLLQITYDRLEDDKLFVSGLCSLISGLAFKKVINHEEYRALAACIKDNQPFTFFFYFKDKAGYFWPQGDKKPRLRWLKKQIRKQK